ncbi:MAG: class I SAM-dependent methyltransferase [Anaerolineales bacterium]|nr:class I SAM-dependent methyltransferase [Anaerolineales bacterium]
MKTVEWLCIYFPLTLIAVHTLIRIIRYFYPFPMPHFMAALIDHPVRRRLIQPPDETAVRHGIQPGMTVLEVGPGSGTYTAAAARRVGVGGQLVAIDIEPRMIERVQFKAEREGLTNIHAEVGDVYQLNYPENHFDLCFMITVISEIPEPVRAMQEIKRVLKPGGIISFSELFLDPDYPLARTVTRWADEAGFKYKQKFGNWFCYTLIFEK